MRRLGNFLFTSESVTEGHPDKMADQISDAILDCLIGQDPNSRVAVETLTTTGLVMISGEVTTNGYCEFPEVVRETVRQIGYTRAKFGFDCETCGVISSIHSQSPDIAQGVDTGGAGDQGMMFGYATTETEELMPMPIMYAHKLTRQLAKVRKEEVLDYLRPDGKSQVSIQYVDGRPARIDSVVVSSQHAPEVTHDQIRNDVIAKVILPVLPKEMIDKETKYYINPTGKFVMGGPMADTGLTGRKIIVDTYGGVSSHGGGAFSGKDPTKVDRSAAYMARYIAKNVVAAGIAEEVAIQLAYAIGVADPVSIMVDTFGTGKADNAAIVKAIREIFHLTPRGIIEQLNLRRPIFKNTAAYGHFGRNEPGFTWENTDKADDLRQAVKL
ncbi:MAG TPA: methionine adenosyltransferase [Candidatus Aminicenantes bacterium]|nr:methionine adenosyltransferase [Candidatus Aminicenantes bacterium]